MSFDFNITGVIETLDRERIHSDLVSSFVVYTVGDHYRFYGTVSTNQVTTFTFQTGFVIADNGYSNNPVVFSIVHSRSPLTVIFTSSSISPPFLVEYTFSVHVALESEELLKYLVVENAIIQKLVHNGVHGWLSLNPIRSGIWNVTMNKSELGEVILSGVLTD